MDPKHFSKFLTLREIRKETTCHLWRGPVAGPYGQFCIGEHSIGAHVAIWEHYFGPVEKGHMVCHTCDNKLCVNPDHLVLGTNQSNQKDSRDKGRHTSAKLTNKDVRIVLELLENEMPVKEIAKLFKVSASCIYLIKNGWRWT